MSKKRILVLPSDRTGVGKFRSVQPHTYLQQQYPDEFHIDIMYDISIDDLNFFKNYDIVSFHRSLNTNYEKSREVIGQLKQMGIKTVCDIDDYWMPGMEHPAHAMVVERKFDKIIVNNLREAEWVTTTTDIFANEIRKTVNKNVHVIPNGIDPEEPQFKEKTIPSDKVRFGWLGGSSHLHDLMILDGTFDKISDLKDKYRLYICGFDTRGTVTEIDKATGTQKQRPILPEETVWAKYEKIFTSNYKYVTEKQKEFLMKWKQEEYMDEPDPFYTRVWTAPVTSYAKNYSKFDVSLAPIKNTMFNRMKSQLKVIEAGFYKKAIIASNIGPYTIDIKHGLNNGEFVKGANGLLVDEYKNHKDWSKFMKKLIENPSWVEDLGEQLYETVNEKYHLKVLSENRRNFYNSL